MKRPKRLSASFVRTVNRPGRYGDGHGGHGLSLLVKARAHGGLAKSWSQRLRINGAPCNLGVCRIGRTGVGEGEQGCWGRRNNNLGNKPSWGSAWRLIWDRIGAANDSRRSIHGRRLPRT